jgi:phenylacetate-coenzyme A ligase PaaK-like adenylate-forming protein
MKKTIINKTDKTKSAAMPNASIVLLCEMMTSGSTGIIVLVILGWEFIDSDWEMVSEIFIEVVASSITILFSCMSGKLTSVFVGHGLRVGHADMVGWCVANITMKPIKKPIATIDEKNATHLAGFKWCPSILI